MDTSRLLTFIETAPFTKRWSEQDVELARLQSELIVNPLAGEVIQGIGGFRKYRFADDNKGKSGSSNISIQPDSPEERQQGRFHSMQDR